MMQQSVKWLITAPEGRSFNECLTIACGGNERLGSLLYFFLGRGAYVVGQKNLNTDEIEYVRLSLSLDQIMNGLKDLQRGASKPSIVQWMHKLNKLGYVISNGYQQQYDIYFHKIAQGITNPPPREVVLRGRHATKKKNQDLSVEEKQNQDLSFNSEGSHSSELNLSVDKQDLSVDYANYVQDLSLKIQDLTLENKDLSLEILNLKSEMLDLKSEILKVKSLISREGTSEAALEGESDAINNISINNSNNLKSNTNASALDEPASVPSKSSSRKNSRRKTPVPAVQPTLPQEPEKPPLALSERGQAVWDAWCGQPWFKRARPTLKETAIGHCNALAESCDPLPTTEEMVKARNWYEKKYPTRQGWQLGNLKEAYPQMLSDNYNPITTERPAPAPTAVFMDQEQANRLATELIASTNVKGHLIQAKPVAIGNNAFGVEVLWNTPLFENPITFKSEKRLRSAFQQMCSVWEDNKKNDRYARKEVI